MKSVYLLLLCSSLLEKCYDVLPRSSLPYTKPPLSSSLFPQVSDRSPWPPLSSLGFAGVCTEAGGRTHCSLGEDITPGLVLRGGESPLLAPHRHSLSAHPTTTFFYLQQHHAVCPSHHREGVYLPLMNCAFVWTWGRTSSLWGWRSPGTGCPGRLWSLLLWRYSRPAWTRSCTACCRWPCFGRRVGLDDPQRSLPTPTILWIVPSRTAFWIPAALLTEAVLANSSFAQVLSACCSACPERAGEVWWLAEVLVLPLPWSLAGRTWTCTEISLWEGKLNTSCGNCSWYRRAC